MNPIGLVDFADLFPFEDGKPVEFAFETFMSMVLDVRESNTATVKDVMNLRMNIKTSTNRDLRDKEALVKFETARLENYTRRIPEIFAEADVDQSGMLS